MKYSDHDIITVCYFQRDTFDLGVVMHDGHGGEMVRWADGCVDPVIKRGGQRFVRGFLALCLLNCRGRNLGLARAILARAILAHADAADAARGTP